jgi:hypothetical protein
MIEHQSTPIHHAPRVSYLAILLTLVAGMFVLTSSPAYACDVEDPPSPDIAVEQATAVFSGEVQELIETERADGETAHAVTFDVSRVWKGVRSETVSVETEASEAICGYPFEVGEQYLVYAHGDPGELYTGLYHRTTSWSAADSDLDVIGEGTSIELIIPDEPADESGSSTNPLLLTGALTLMVGLVATIMLVRRARAAAELEELD